MYESSTATPHIHNGDDILSSLYSPVLTTLPISHISMISDLQFSAPVVCSPLICYRAKPIFVVLYKVKVKFTLVQALRLCTGRTAHRGVEV